MLKRIFDVIFSLLALLALLPVFLILTLWIKLDSKGPVFYRQSRVGMDEKLFQIYKFRTMRTDYSDKLQITVSEDPRITRAGFFLRKYKLDELAQFINVLLGDMSVVGPRPEVPKYVDYYPEEDREKIFSMRPGITDKASLEFKNENEMLDSSLDPEQTYIKKILPVKLKYYTEYVDSYSFIDDLVIIWRTIIEIFIK